MFVAVAVLFVRGLCLLQPGIPDFEKFGPAQVLEVEILGAEERLIDLRTLRFHGAKGNTPSVACKIR